MLVSFEEEKTGECVVCCHRCGAFLMESAKPFDVAHNFIAPFCFLCTGLNNLRMINGR